MALRDARAGATSAAFLQLTLITLACTVISVSAQLPIPWAPPQEESFINGQITTSPFAFQPGTALDGSHQCLTNTTLSPPLVVAAPCFTAGSNEYSNLADKWTWNFKDQTVHPWIGAQYRQPGAYCLDGGSLIIAPGSTYSSTFISIAPCVAQSPTQQWWWDGAYLQILPTIQKDRWFAASTTDSTHFQLTSNRSAATPLNFVLPPYSKECKFWWAYSCLLTLVCGKATASFSLLMSMVEQVPFVGFVLLGLSAL